MSLDPEQLQAGTRQEVHTSGDGLTPYPSPHTNRRRTCTRASAAPVNGRLGVDAGVVVLTVRFPKNGVNVCARGDTDHSRRHNSTQGPSQWEKRDGGVCVCGGGGATREGERDCHPHVDHSNTSAHHSEGGHPADSSAAGTRTLSVTSNSKGTRVRSTATQRPTPQLCGKSELSQDGTQTWYVSGFAWDRAGQ
jgi:hypothetical protein